MSDPSPAVVVAVADEGRFEARVARADVEIRRLSASGTDEWRQVVALGGESAVSLAEGGGRVYAALYAPEVTGCRVVALDAEFGELLWERLPEGLGVGLHSKYRNDVELNASPAAVVVIGRESAGSYRETLDAESGRTLSREVLAS